MDPLIEYIFRDMKNGEFWLDIVVDRQPYYSLGPFESEAARQVVHDDLIGMMRSMGARDVPKAMQ